MISYIFLFLIFIKESKLEEKTNSAKELLPLKLNVTLN
jgi:hypothetical protein